MRWARCARWAVCAAADSWRTRGGLAVWAGEPTLGPAAPGRKVPVRVVTASIPLSVEEVSALAGLLGAPQLAGDLRKENGGLTGVHTKQLSVLHGSPFDGRTLGDTQLRTRTAVSVVAVVRAGTMHPSPRPDFTLGGGDALITVGTTEELVKAADVLDRG